MTNLIQLPMKFSAAALLALSAFVLPAAPLTAQPDTAAVEDSPEVDARLRVAGELADIGDYKGARREYDRVAALQRARGELPGRALWLSAQMSYSRHQHQRAAVTLEALAKEAQRYGDPVLQARALIEAAVLYQHAGMGKESLACLKQLKPLLSSPYLSAQARAAIEERIRA